MKYNDLTISSNRDRNRVGRGIAANQGKTAGRGTKGQKSRTGSKKKPGFEGGSNPLLQRLPKLPGFRSIHLKIVNVSTGELNELKVKEIDNHAIAKAGLVNDPYTKVKLITQGKLDKAVNVKLQAASKSAQAMVKKSGGSFESVPQVGRVKAKVESKTKK